MTQEGLQRELESRMTARVPTGSRETVTARGAKNRCLFPLKQGRAEC
jgi:hypothetical protein